MKTLHLSVITIILMAISLVTISHFTLGFQQDGEKNYPIIDMPKIMSIVQNSTDFIEKTDRYDHYLLAKATLRPTTEKTGNTLHEEYDLVYALYRSHSYCYFENLLDVTLDDTLNVTSTKEYSLSNEPAGYPQPPVSCLMNLEPPKMDYNPLLIILPPSPFATVNETFNASSDGTIVFSGTVHKLFSKYITLTVFDPKGEQVATSQPQPEPDGTFSQTFQPFSPLWSMTGNYTVSITSVPHNLVESPFYFKGVGCCMTESPLHYTDQGLPPLEQWKSYVPVRNTICAKDLQLIIKAEDGSPACVKPETAQKLTERGWAELENFGASPIREIKIVGLQQTYNPGQPIVVSVSYTGYINSGIDPDVKIIDANGTQVWDSCCFAHTESTIPYFHTATFNVQGPTLMNGSVNTGYPFVNKIGIYTMVASLDNKSAEAKFSVVNQSYLNQNSNSNKIVGVVAIQMIPPYNPGGPMIQLTLKNTGMKPITSLKAVLELYNNYTFDFKDVTPSTPLSPGNSTTDTETLIGGGFQTELAYPLIINGTEDNTPFRYTEKVHIQG